MTRTAAITTWRDALAERIVRDRLLAKACILMLCLIYALPNVWAVRTLFYVLVLPLYLVSVSRSDLTALLRAPIFLTAAAYLLVFIVAAPFAAEFVPQVYWANVRNTFLLLAFLAILAYEVRHDGRFVFELTAIMGVTAAATAAANIAVYYDYFAHFAPQVRLEGIAGMTMFLNSNWVALIYAIPCVAAAAAATYPGVPRALVGLLIVAALVLLGAVMLAQGRGVLIGVAAGLAAVVVLLPRQIDPVVRRAIWTGAGVLVAGAVVFAIATQMLARADSYRLFVWTAYLPYVEAHPWVGAGLSAKLPIMDHAGFETIHPHNIVYHSLLRGGAFAAATLVLLFLLVLVQSIREWRRTGLPMLPALVLVSLVPFQFEFNTVAATPPGWDWVTLWLAVGLALGSSLMPRASATKAA